MTIFVDGFHRCHQVLDRARLHENSCFIFNNRIYDAIDAVSDGRYTASSSLDDDRSKPFSITGQHQNIGSCHVFFWFSCFSWPPDWSHASASCVL